MEKADLESTENATTAPIEEQHQGRLESRCDEESIHSANKPLPLSQSDSFWSSFVRKLSFPVFNMANTFSQRPIPRGPIQETLKQKIWSLFIDWWLFEILCMVISTGCFIAIITVLASWNNQPLPSHWPMNINLTTLIAIIAAFAKYSLSMPLEVCLGQLKWTWFQTGRPRQLLDLERFDQASRGPVGAALLVIHTKGGSLASFVCILVLLTLGFDPFFQQLISFPQRPVSFGTSTLERVVDFEIVGDWNVMDATVISQEDNLLLSVVQDTIEGYGSSVQPNGLCPSSNCEWPSFQTLALCSACTDVSDLLQYGCAVEDGSWMPSRSSAILGLNNITNIPPNTTSCGWYLNITSDARILMSGVNTNTSEALWMRLLPMWSPELNETYWDRSFAFQSIADTWPLADFMISLSPNKSAVYAQEKPMLSECIFRWCVQTITAKSVDGVFSEQVEAEWYNDTAVPNPLGPKWKDGILDIHPLYDQLLTPPGSNETFRSQSNSTLDVHYILSSYLPTFYTYQNDSAATPPAVTINNVPYNTVIENQYYIVDTNRSTLSTVTNASSFAESIASAISDALRTYPNSTEPVQGYGGLQSYIQIQWAWIALPIFVLVFTFFAVMLTIFSSPARSDGGVWKTSLLASILHGMEDETRHSFGNAWNMSEILKKSKTVRIKMRTNSDGYTFQRS